MTVWDDLGPHAADLASWWPESRDSWTLVYLAEQLWLRRLVDTREDLETYKAVVAAELEAFKSSHVDDDELTVDEQIALVRLEAAVLVLGELDYSTTFNPVVARLAMAEDVRQRKRIGRDGE